MSTKAQAVWSQLYGEPLTDDEIEQSARVTLRMLDNEDKIAELAAKEHKDRRD
jgi:hypothetical protein